MVLLLSCAAQKCMTQHICCWDALCLSYDVFAVIACSCCVTNAILLLSSKIFQAMPDEMHGMKHMGLIWDCAAAVLCRT
jgi:hypothetical protein